ncbi:hypothetical protein LF1_33500 [Rubripirellula obstinata]|uniref:PEP-CTERM protein-sorting domain-containing protein n=1 Tax=Rubripirellula obstinata TaxID=406547 RepID=A0A5B1CI35_9BACT|nr:PEP-CTERM sorting domain-containing protein [Rubripirellula obstinata]KAA1260808.1 hypothetical protein LF1_33500 [Rubripirellula obstinata]
MKNMIFGCIAALMMMNSAKAEVVFSESFDDATGFTTSTPFFADNFGDFFGLAEVTDGFGANVATPGGVKEYTGFTGGFLTGMDLDGEGATLPVTVDWTGIDISGRPALSFAGDFAEFFDTPGDIDADDSLFVEAQIDGGGYSTILEFTPGLFDNNTFNGFFTNGNLSLGSEAQRFTAPITGTGNLLDLRLTVSVNSGDEDFAVDSFSVTAIPEPGSFAALSAIACFGMSVRRRRSIASS